MKKILLFIMGMLMSISIYSQAGAFCEGATPFPNSNSCFSNQSLTTDIQWYNFVAGETTENIQLQNLNTFTAHIHRMEFYTGTCAGNNLVLSDSVEVTPTNDTLLVMTETGLTIGTTYYIKLLREDACVKCQNGSANYNLCLLAPITPQYTICGLLPGSSSYVCCTLPNTGDTCFLFTVCVGTPVELFAFNGTYYGGGSAFDFVSSGGSLSGNVVTFSTSGTYYVGTYLTSYAGDPAAYVYAQINVVDAVPVSFTASPNPVCQGQQICFTNTTAPPFNDNNYEFWDFGDGNTQAPPCFLPTCDCNTYATAGTYTVTLSMSGGCPGTATQEITVNPPSVKIIPDVACLGATTTFNIIFSCFSPADIDSWTWNWGDGTTSSGLGGVIPFTHTYPTSGFYTATLTIVDLLGNTFTANTSVSVAPLPPAPIITTPLPNIICSSGTSVIYTITNFVPPASSYTVSITSGIASASSVNSSGQFTIIWGSTTGGQFVITVTDAKGCQNSTTIDIIPCCAPSSPLIHNFVNTNATALIAFYTTGSTVVGKVFYINGTFTVNENLTLEGCDVSLGPDAIINITNNSTFRIADNSILKAGCGVMWDGIYIPNSSHILQVKTSVIQDAKNAIVSNNGGIYDIAASQLNKNYKSIVVNTYAPHHLGAIGGTTISCIATPTSSGTLLLAPYSTERSPVGIEINNVTNTLPINIGSTGGITGRNTFNNLDIGVYSYQSNVSVKYNDFKNIQTTGGQVATSAIYAIGKPFFPFPTAIYNLTVGGYGFGGTEGNTFYNCLTGVFTTLNMSVNVYKNDFNIIRNYAVHCEKSGLFNTINIKNNDIQNAKVGIHCYANNICTTEIFLNKIKVVGLYATLLGNTYGILIQELSSSSTNSSYNVFDNKIQNIRNGIRADNLYKAIIDNNKIDVRSSGSSSLSPATGIAIYSNNLTRVTSSEIQAIPASSALWVGGIYASVSTNSYIGCNITLKNLGYAIQCSGAMNPSTVFNNNMTSCTRGIWLSNGGFIDQQGNATSPTYNKWNGSFTAQTYTSGTGALATDGSLSKFYVRMPGPPFSYIPTSNFNAGGANVSIPILPASGSAIAPFCVIYPPPMIVAGGGLRQQIAQNSIPFASSEAMWLSKSSVYTELLNDSTLLSNPLLDDFKDSIELSSMGKLHKVKKALGNSALASSPSDLLSAVNDNNSVVASLPIETESKTVNDLLLSNMQIGQTTFDATQLSTLRAIANECPFIYGVAVYEARMLVQPYDSIGTVYLNPCEVAEENRSMIANGQDNDVENGIQLFPNPNKGSMTLTYHLNDGDRGELIIFDLAGRKLNSYVLNANSSYTTIEESNLSNGIYLYQVFINDKSVKTDRIIIIK